MPDQAVIEGLIASFRELNHRIRAASPSVMTDDSLKAALRALRDRELRASQAIKQLLLGEAVEEDDEAPAEVAEFQARRDLPANVLLSQFGTAREATLTSVRALPDEQWNQTYRTPRGEMTLRDYLKTLVDRDQQALEKLQPLLSKASV